jgi:hypothetical protein
MAHRRLRFYSFATKPPRVLPLVASGGKLRVWGTIMRAVIAAVLQFVLFAAPWRLPLRPSAVPKSTRPEILLRWINGYRTHGNVERVPEVVQAMSRLGVFRDLRRPASTSASWPAYADQSAEGGEAGGTHVPDAPEDQIAIVRAIAYPSCPTGKT